MDALVLEPCCSRRVTGLLVLAIVWFMLDWFAGCVVASFGDSAAVAVSLAAVSVAPGRTCVGKAV